jgi:hypothetical protein
MKNEFIVEPIQLDELESVKGGADNGYDGCLICNGKCGDGGCLITNGKCGNYKEDTDDNSDDKDNGGDTPDKP